MRGAVPPCDFMARARLGTGPAVVDRHRPPITITGRGGGGVVYFVCFSRHSARLWGPQIAPSYCSRVDSFPRLRWPGLKADPSPR